MKKFFIVIFIIIVLCGCSSSKIDNEKNLYLKYIKELKSVKKSTKEYPFDIEVRYDRITKDEIRYQIVIDNVKQDITDIEALAIHNRPTDDIFPSIGIFDDKQKLGINKKPEGIILVGYINYSGKIEDFKCEIKLLVKYKINKKVKKVYYVTKK